MKNIEDNYRNKKWFSLNSLADFIAEYNKDGKYDKSAWNFWRWLDRKYNKNLKQRLTK